MYINDVIGCIYKKGRIEKYEVKNDPHNCLICNCAMKLEQFRTSVGFDSSHWWFSKYSHERYIIFFCACNENSVG